MSKGVRLSLGCHYPLRGNVAVVYWLDEVKNDITRETPASFQPTMDHIVTKIPRFGFEN